MPTIPAPGGLAGAIANPPAGAQQGANANVNAVQQAAQGVQNGAMAANQQAANIPGGAGANPQQATGLWTKMQDLNPLEFQWAGSASMPIEYVTPTWWTFFFFNSSGVAYSRDASGAVAGFRVLRGISDYQAYNGLLGAVRSLKRGDDNRTFDNYRRANYSKYTSISAGSGVSLPQLYGLPESDSELAGRLRRMEVQGATPDEIGWAVWMKKGVEDNVKPEGNFEIVLVAGSGMLMAASTKGAVAPNTRASSLGSFGSGSGVASKAELIEGLRGSTAQAGRIADAIENGTIKVNLLGDYLYDFAIKGQVGERAAQIENQIYLRKGSASVLSDALHEGTHALDYTSGYGFARGGPVSRYSIENRAYFYERQFQLWTNQPLEHSSISDLLNHVRTGYPNDLIRQ